MLTLDQGDARDDLGQDEQGNQQDQMGIKPNERFGSDKNSDMNGGNRDDDRTGGDRTAAGRVPDRQYESHPQKRVR